MKILIVHNHYIYSGGEDEVVKAEKQLLERFGHQVILYEQSNTQFSDLTLFKKLIFTLKGVYWSKRSYDAIHELIEKEKPDIAHFHNTFFMISSSAYDACYEAGIPIVQTLHNYRFICPNGLFYRDGQICEDCTLEGRRAAVKNKCWRNSRFYSRTLTRVIDNFEKQRILSNKISRFIALTDFSKQKFVENNFDRNKITIKPNFLDVKTDEYREENKNYGVFIGALRDYKGILTLIEAWKNIKKEFTLKIIGDGPLFQKLKEKCQESRIELMGAKTFVETLEIIRKSLFVVIPSECYENFPRVTIEAFAHRVPVIASNHGAMKDIVDNGRTGLLFDRGNSNDLTLKLNTLIDDPVLAKQLGVNARKQYEQYYTGEINYKMLMEVYKQALEEA